MILEAIGWIASGLIIAGQWLMGRRKTSAPVYCVLGNVLWTIYAVEKHLWSLLFVTVICLGTMLRSSILWRKQPCKT